MNIEQSIILSIVPVALTVSAGYVAGKGGFFSTPDSIVISRLVLDWIFPALMLVSMASTPRGELLDIRLIAVVFIGIFGVYALCMVGDWLAHRQLRRATLRGLVVSFPDAAFMGIPIMHSLFPTSGLYPILVLNLVALVLLVPISSTLLRIGATEGNGGKAFLVSVAEAVRKPLVWAPIIGILISMLNIKLPLAISASFHLLGGATSGVSLFCLGLIMSQHTMRPSREVVVNVLLKNVLHPMFVVVLCMLLDVHGTSAIQIVVLCALPSATITAILSKNAQCYEAEAAASIFAGTFLSILTLPVVIMWVSSAQRIG